MADRGGALDPKRDPRRRCLKLQNWPDVDRRAWQAAVAEGSLLHGGGAAAHWRATTQKTVQDGYGRWLTFLGRNGRLDPDVAPAERVSPQRLRAFIADLQATVAPITVRTRITDLAEALRVMAPEADIPDLVWLAPALLQHADRRTAEMHYDQARDVCAVGLWQEQVRAARRTAAKATVRSPRSRGRR